MEQVIAPPEIIDAIAGGDLAAIEAWVAAGGDPNAKIDCSRHVGAGRSNSMLPHSEVRDSPPFLLRTMPHDRTYANFCCREARVRRHGRH